VPAADRHPCVAPPTLAANHPSISISDPMELALVTLLNGLVYGMLLFMLASGLTLIFSLMGVLNFAHASIYMIGA